MTTADYGDHRRKPLIRAAVFLGHYLGPWNPLTLVFVWAGIVFTWWRPDTSPAFSTFVAVLVPVLLVGFITMVIHDNALCPRDTHEAETALNPQAAIERHDRLLKAYHNRPMNWALLAAQAAGMSLLILPVASWPAAVKAAASVAGAVTVAGFLFISRKDTVHARLQLWCPYCRGDGDGDGDCTPAPAPQPVGERTV